MECTFAGVNQFIGQVLLADWITLRALVKSQGRSPPLKNEEASDVAGAAPSHPIAKTAEEAVHGEREAADQDRVFSLIECL
jgi:hypothetical protein